MTATDTKPIQIIHSDHRLYGAPGALLDLVDSGNLPDEVLIEGPSGTGKSYGILVVIVMLCEMFPGIRVLLCRKTLTSMRDTILVTLEDKVFPKGHPAMRGGSRRNQQHPRYRFPDGSEIVCASFEDVEKIKSSDYDLIYANEGTELTVTDWETALTRLRNGKLPIGQCGLIDCNPSFPTHWLNKRPEQQKIMDGKPAVDSNGKPIPQAVRLRSRHEDNPSLIAPETGERTEHGRKYIDKLDSLTGVRYRRYRLGQWCAAEGQIWGNYDPAVHCINGDLAKNKKSGRWELLVPAWDKTIELRWFFASVDWGFRSPGSLQVWGVDPQRRKFRVRELYCPGLNANLWAIYAEITQRKFDVARFVCDPAEPDSIEVFNIRMGRRDGYWLADVANNDFKAGTDVVRENLEARTAFLVGDAHNGVLGDILEYAKLAPVGETRKELEDLADKIIVERAQLAEAKKCMSAEDEIPSYCYREFKDGQKVKEEAAPGSENHSCDTTRYAMMFTDRQDWDPGAHTEPTNQPGSLGRLLGHAEIWSRIRSGECAEDALRRSKSAPGRSVLPR